MIKDVLSDIIKHTSDLGLYSMVKVTSTATDLTVESIDEGKTVVFFGKLNSPSTDINGTLGLARLGVLKGYLNFPSFAAAGATITINTKTTSAGDIPSDVSFVSSDGHTASYRFMSESIISEQLKVPPFKGATWNVSVKPTKEGISNLIYMNSILGSFEDTFTVSTNGDCLDFLIGSGASDKTKITFASGITGSLKHGWAWPIAPVLTILKLYNTSSRCEMFISDQGALKIEIASELGTYQYILPARSK